MRGRGAAGLLGLALLVVGSTPAPYPVSAAAPVAVVAEYDGIIHPIATEFITGAIERADTSGAALTVIILRTPGGLLESTRTIVSRIIAARAPVVVFIGPAGGRAASAGFLITLAADVAAMAPGTHIGAAHPVSATGGEASPSETMAKKIASDAAAYARTLAEARKRNATLAAEAVTQSRAFTASEALAAEPPLIDLTAPDVHDLLRQLDGRTITRFDGRTVTLRTAGITTEQVGMTRRQQFLSAIADPQIAYLLLTLGTLGLTVELWNPGTVLPGVVGGLCLLLAFFAFQVLPINTVGLLLVLFGIGLLVLELKVPSFGVLGVGGAASLMMGSVMLTREVPGVTVSYGIIVPTVATLVVLFLFLGRLGLQAQRRRPVTGVDGLVGEHGRTIDDIAPDRTGHVRVHGEIWQATCATPVGRNHPVRVAAVDGLTLRVEPVATTPPEGGTS